MFTSCYYTPAAGITEFKLIGLISSYLDVQYANRKYSTYIHHYDYQLFLIYENISKLI